MRCIAAGKESAVSTGGSLNDAFVAAVTGGLRRHHERQNVSVDELRITMPSSVRNPDDPAASNRITLARFKVPVGMANPAEHIRLSGRCCRSARDERALPPSNTIARVDSMTFGPGLLRARPLKWTGEPVDSTIPDIAGPGGSASLARLDRGVRRSADHQRRQHDSQRSPSNARPGSTCDVERTSVDRRQLRNGIRWPVVCWR